jgi:hypothetical protein
MYIRQSQHPCLFQYYLHIGLQHVSVTDAIDNYHHKNNRENNFKKLFTVSKIVLNSHTFRHERKLNFRKTALLTIPLNVSVYYSPDFSTDTSTSP